MLDLLRSFIRSLPTLLLAFVLSIAVWVSAVTDADPIEERVYPRALPLEVVGKSDDLAITTTVPSQIFVTLSAPQSVWDRLINEPEQLRAILDLSKAQEGEEVYSIDIEVDLQPVDVVSYTPRTVNLNLENLIANAFPIRLIRQGEPAVGFEVDTPVLSQNIATVSGPEYLVEQIQEVRATLDIDEAEAEIKQSLVLIATGVDDKVIEGVEIEPEKVTVTQGVTQLGGYRNLVVKVVVKGQISNGYRLTNISSFPAAVTVFSSDPGLVDDLPGYVETEPLDVSGAKDDLDVQLLLNLPAGVSVVGDATVQVQVGIAAIESSLALSNMNVVVEGLGEGLAATISPDKVDVILAGPLPLLEQLETDQIRVYVDLEGDQLGDYQRIPIVELAVSDLYVQSILPETVSVVVENKTIITGRATRTPTPTATLDVNVPGTGKDVASTQQEEDIVGGTPTPSISVTPTIE